MQRLLLTAAVLASGIGLFGAGAAPAQASRSLDAVNSSVTNSLLNLIPGLGGPDTRNICLIDDGINKSLCINIPLP
jgi:hypothetical protein